MHKLVSITLIVSAFLLQQCGSEKKENNTPEIKEGTIYSIKIDTDSQSELTEDEFLKCRKIISNRLKAYDIPSSQFVFGDNNVIEVLIHGKSDQELVSKLIRSNISLQFREMYGLEDILDSLKVIDKEIRQKEENNFDESPSNLFHNTLIYNNIDQAGIGMCLKKDTANVISILNQNKDKFPKDIQFTWTIMPTEGYYILLAIKKTENARIKALGTEIENVNVDNQNGFWTIFFQFGGNGADVWEKMTRDNIGKYIAIMMDDVVYSYPMVQSEIKGGSCMITGDFTLEQAKEMASLIELSSPYRFYIQSIEVRGPKLGE